MLKRRDMHFDDLPFPKTPRKLPMVLSPEEVRRMIDRRTNLMQRTILMVLYGTGVRRTELSLGLVGRAGSGSPRRASRFGLTPFPIFLGLSGAARTL